jgi:hypothetical protein
MHKLVILIEPLEDWSAFDESWPEFLHLAEAMPGLQREASCLVRQFLLGVKYAQVHELYFSNLQDAQAAMASPEGRSAGRLLQQMTQGKMTIFIADHKEDDIERIKKFQKQANP